MILIFIAVLAQLLDVFTTLIAISNGAIECNPVFGFDPNLWLVSFAKLVVMSGLYLYVNTPNKRVLLIVIILWGVLAATVNIITIGILKMYWS